MPTAPNGKHPFWPSWHEQPGFSVALMLVMAFLIVFLMAKTSQTLSLIQHAAPSEHQITVDGYGKVEAAPDIASISMGVESKGKDVSSAQTANTTATNALIAAIAAAGIPKNDMQTSSYNAYEDKQWNPDTQTYDSSGWIVSQQLTVKVRDVSKVAAVLDAAGKNGATNISDPTFTIDDPSALKQQAREKAVTDARERAMQLAKALGVHLGRVVGYTEYTDQTPIPFYNARTPDASAPSAAPEVLPGTNEVTLNVSVTYQLAD